MALTPEANAPPAAPRQFPCQQCGAKLDFDPQARAQKCPHCGTENAIPQSEEDIAELDYAAALAALSDQHEEQEQLAVRCGQCGAECTLEPDVVSGVCPFCASNIVAEGASKRVLKPRSLLPFKIGREQARAAFGQWIRRLWFAPRDLQDYAREEGRLVGLYVPYWTYDTDTVTFYRGERGDDYWATETYTEYVNGRAVTRTRQVRRTRWTSVSGTVWVSFDDLLVLASRSLPQKYAEQLEPWDLENLIPYQDEYLSGFRAEGYQVGLAEGFTRARELMQEPIEKAIRDDIGGDHQQIHSAKTQYNNLTFKHLLLPVWMSAYRYRDRVYRILVNARTGEVQGERPYSWAKIGLFVLGILAALAVAVMFLGR